jgi:hypothetical protein
LLALANIVQAWLVVLTQCIFFKAVLECLGDLLLLVQVFQRHKGRLYSRFN